MLTATAIALTCFIAWALALLVLMEGIRTGLVLSGQVRANGFRPDNADLSPFMQRLARAHANCVEGLPIFGGLMIVALLIDRTDVTDPLAYALLAMPVVQSLVHLASLSVAAVFVRFSAFAVQMAIGVYWAVMLLLALA